MKRPLLVTAVLMLAVLATGLPRDHAAAQTAGLTVLAGNGEPGYAVNLFLPNQVTIPAGSTLTWRNPWNEGHQVAFLGTTTAPPVGSPAVMAPTHAGQVVVYDGVSFVNSGRYGATTRSR